MYDSTQLAARCLAYHSLRFSWIRGQRHSMCCRVSCVGSCNRAHTLQTGYLFAHASQQRNIEAQGAGSLAATLQHQSEISSVRLCMMRWTGQHRRMAMDSSGKYRRAFSLLLPTHPRVRITWQTRLLYTDAFFHAILTARMLHFSLVKTLCPILPLHGRCAKKVPRWSLAFE